jgi:hypothetical protein
MAYKSENYTPHKRSQKILAQAWEHIQSVPYQVTARWLFYRLLQDGYYKTKSDYDNKFLPLLSRARHCFYEGWRPDTLADDRRTPIIRGDGYESPAAWVEMLTKRAGCNLARWDGQSHYVEVWFEAEAMKSQFEHYTESITLRPFYGMPSIPYKWDIAKDLERARQNYGLPIIVLYFGDLDPAGETIPETSTEDIRGWCSVGFDFIRAGLNPGDEVRYSIPENFDHPGAYQWEALEDSAARELITGAVAQFVDYDKMEKIEDLETEVTAQFRRYMTGFEWGTQ